MEQGLGLLVKQALAKARELLAEELEHGWFGLGCFMEIVDSESEEVPSRKIATITDG